MKCHVCARPVVLCLRCLLSVLGRANMPITNIISSLVSTLFLFCFLEFFGFFLGRNLVCICFMHLVCCCLLDCVDFCCFYVVLFVWFGIFMHVLMYFCALCLVCSFCVLLTPPGSFLAPSRHACISCLGVCAELCLCPPLPHFLR